MTSSLDKLAAIVAARTPGPWAVTDDGDQVELNPGPGDYAYIPCEFRDAAFIAAMGTLADQLLAVAKAAKHVRAEFLPRLLHGDDAHRQWLQDEFEMMFAPFDRALAALESKLEELP